MELIAITDAFNKLIANCKTPEAAIVEADAELAAAVRSHSIFEKLIVYGSLAPGQSNHDQLEDVEGKWKPVTVTGILENAGWAIGDGYPGFRFAAHDSAITIHAQLFSSPMLPQYWERLDKFEGEEYKRVLVVYHTPEAQGLGFIYALA